MTIVEARFFMFEDKSQVIRTLGPERKLLVGAWKGFIGPLGLGDDVSTVAGEVGEHLPRPIGPGDDQAVDGGVVTQAKMGNGFIGRHVSPNRMHPPHLCATLGCAELDHGSNSVGVT